MRTRTRRWNGGYHRHDWLYALVLTLAALMVPLCLTVMLWLLPSTQAADNWQVDGAHGVLHVRGELTESACRLEMASAYQAVSLGNRHGHDVRLGSRGAPLALAVGQQALNYTVTPERTRAPLVPGAYAAVVDFQLSYD
ncbi:fimbrial protein [Serratia marcescens]|uniref:fimbrial protein n=1 Tax=Serratia marcescens TaxID=615 RepID=UPI0004010E52|nr:hypothetical protein [Serratia marcescens]